MTQEAFADRRAERDGALVTAVITTHDRAPGMVLRAVNSVLRQTYQNMELIVVDDSSPSFAQRAEVERSVRGASAGIVYLKHEACRGACAARNTGLSHARGDYVGFLDDDDEWMPTKIEEQLKGFRDESTALVYCQSLMVDDEKRTARVESVSHESGYVFDKLLRRNFICSTSNPLIRKACMEAVGGFDTLMESCQDYDLWLRLALRYPVQYVDAALLRYHIHSGKRIMTDAERKIKGIERILSKYADYFDKDDEAWLTRYSALIPNYLKGYGRKESMAVWITCVKRCPGKIAHNFKMLVKIVMGVDSYMTIRRKLDALYHRLRENGRA